MRRPPGNRAPPPGYLFGAHHAGLPDIGAHPAVGIQQVHLDARIHRHQHRKQGLACGKIGLHGIRQDDLGPVFDDMPGQAVRQALQGFLLVLGGNMPTEQADQRAKSEQEQGQRNGQAPGERKASAQAAGSSKR